MFSDREIRLLLGHQLLGMCGSYWLLEWSSALRCKFLVHFLHSFDKKILLHPAMFLCTRQTFYTPKTTWFGRFSHYKHGELFSHSINSSQSGHPHLIMLPTTATLTFVVQRISWKCLVEEAKFLNVINILQLRLCWNCW